MSSQRQILPLYDKRRQRGIRSARNLEVPALNAPLLPNDHLEAWLLFRQQSVTSYRRLVSPFTPLITGFQKIIPTTWKLLKITFGPLTNDGIFEGLTKFKLAENTHSARQSA